MLVDRLFVDVYYCESGCMIPYSLLPNDPGPTRTILNVEGIYPPCGHYSQKGKCGSRVTVHSTDWLWTSIYGPHFPFGFLDKLNDTLLRAYDSGHDYMMTSHGMFLKLPISFSAFESSTINPN